MEKFSLSIPSQAFFNAMDIFPEDSDYKKIHIFPYGRGSILMSFTDHSFYAHILDERTPIHFVLYPENSQDFMEIFQKNAKPRFEFQNKNNGYAATISFFNTRHQEYQTFLEVFSTLYYKTDALMMWKTVQTIFLETSNGRYNKDNDILHEEERGENYHFKLTVEPWMVGKKFKIFASKRVAAYILIPNEKNCMYGLMAWIWGGDDIKTDEIYSPEKFKAALRRKEINTYEDVDTVLFVDNNHGIHMVRVFAEYYPEIVKDFANEEEIAILLKNDRTPDEEQIASEIWFDIITGSFEDENGVKWVFYTGPFGDLLAYNEDQFDQLPEKEKEAFNGYN